MIQKIKAGTRLLGQEGIWSKNLMILAAAIFLLSLGTGLQNGVNTNFMQELGLTDSQVLIQAGIREIPGLGLMFIAAMLTRLPLTWRAVASVFIMGVGFALYAAVHSWSALVVVSLMASLGFHLWMPWSNSIGLGLVSKAHSGKVLGTLASIGALASMVGIGSIMLLNEWFDLRVMAGIAGVIIVIAAVVLTRLPKKIGESSKPEPRLLFRWHYWLYYVLLLFEGSRTQVFSAFNIMVLVYNYHLQAVHISYLLLASGLVNFILAPRIGRLLDVIGEKTTLTVGYIALALCFVGYALVNNVWFLCVMVVFINLLVTLSMGLSTYVNRIAPEGELTPTLSTGVSINHITSVGMSFLAGFLLPIIGYKVLCWGVVGMVLLSVPFTLAMKTISPKVLISSEE